ncbi:uncharacterized protein LOC143186152 [Calliopsis andreniformis]|uniref:uncharacterized protein LOC143186152 n=1 Tax=Calliopsis andreniformis TaxID=337506 RepID=UPI003FCEDED4
MRFLRQSIHTEHLKKLYGEPIGTKIKYFWRKGWDEIPELMIFMPIVIGASVAAGFILREMANDTKVPKYYNNITIYRPNNPRVATITKDETLKPEKPPMW